MWGLPTEGPGSLTDQREHCTSCLTVTRHLALYHGECILSTVYRQLALNPASPSYFLSPGLEDSGLCTFATLQEQTSPPSAPLLGFPCTLITGRRKRQSGHHRRCCPENTIPLSLLLNQYRRVTSQAEGEITAKAPAHPDFPLSHPPSHLSQPCTCSHAQVALLFTSLLFRDATWGTELSFVGAPCRREEGSQFP